MKNLRIFMAGFLLAGMIMWGVTGLAENVFKSVSVVFNNIIIKVNGETKAVEHLNYNGKTYVQLRGISEIFDKEIEWDASTATVYIDDRDSVKLKQASPFPDQNDYYPKYDYLYLVFSQEMKNCTDLSKISLTSGDGQKIPFRSVQPGTTNRDNLIFILDKDLKLNTEYQLNIPKNTLESVDNKKYQRDISVKFKTAHTVLKGTVKADRNLYGAVVTIDNTYKSILVEDGRFVFCNIESGNHKIKVVDADGKYFEREIKIENGILNKLDFIAEFK